jgi:formimidoylglutamate deiminase
MKLFADDALLPDGWARSVTIEVDAAGVITAVTRGAPADGAERASGALIPGMPNVHSHAFQRAIAGRTGARAQAGDSFWTWRQAMYGFLDHVDADAFEAVTAQCYVEMLKAGYTSVAEFHYVHNDPAGLPYGDPAELARRVIAAAKESRIGLTLLPVFYAHSGFGGAAPALGQRRFLNTVDGFARLVDALRRDASEGACALGVAPHSLRAVTPAELASIVAMAEPVWPIHIHAAEQVREVADSIAWSGARPVQWLLDHAEVDARWCIVHATHLLATETRKLAAAGAVVGLASTTEADLGDGTFSARAWQDAGGTFGIGTDSNTVIDPFAELRQLEWSQRLAHGARNVLGGAAAPVGQALHASAVAGGARALGRSQSGIAVGARADLIVLNADDAALAGLPVDALVDAAVFGPCRQPVRDVMVAGQWVVRDGCHPREAEILARYRREMLRLAKIAGR